MNLRHFYINRSFKRVKNKRSPWITKELLRQINKRDFLKKKAASTNDCSIWKQFKDARNKANNSVNKAKRQCFLKTLMQTKVILLKPGD